MLAGMGLSGWRTNARDVIGEPDVVFDGERVAVFADGCFWHGCPYCRRKLPNTNRVYWELKITRNIERASLTAQRLLSDGWQVVRIWEHEMATADARMQVRATIRALLQHRKEMMDQQS